MPQTITCAKRQIRIGKPNWFLNFDTRCIPFLPVTRRQFNRALRVAAHSPAGRIFLEHLLPVREK